MDINYIIDNSTISNSSRSGITRSSTSSSNPRRSGVNVSSRSSSSSSSGSGSDSSRSSVNSYFNTNNDDEENGFQDFLAVWTTLRLPASIKFRCLNQNVGARNECTENESDVYQHHLRCTSHDHGLYAGMRRQLRIPWKCDKKGWAKRH